jgi:hypothetical protein
VIFNHDSLYAVGGKLTIECLGKVRQDTLYKLNNKFRVVTDTLAANHTDTLRTKRILIDKDPTNAMFGERLDSDRAKAIAWQEYAGSSDQNHCHEHRNGGIIYNPHFNNYWDIFIDTQADTCIDSLTPCENAQGTDTGILQIYRTIWETTFDSTQHQREYPRTFQICKWDSLAWNWQINIKNGKWIFGEAMPSKMFGDQKDFPDSCSYADCDSVPDTANQEDLENYGYHAGAPKMKRIKTTADWKKYINNPTDPDDIKFAKYIRLVRRYRYRGNLW